MGPASKRRGDTTSSTASNTSRSMGRSAKSATGRVKDKSYKADEDGGKSSRSNRSRIGRRSASTSPTPDASRRRRNFDPTMLARGMSSRSVGALVGQQLTVLSSDEIERDLRHMEAYTNACTAYAQQFFIFHNRALVQAGHFGPVSSPGLVTSDHYLANGSADGYGYQAHPGGQYGSAMMQRGQPSPRYRDGRPMTGSQFAMPVRIDPEEEKRVAMLRKRIAASEAQRELLETEYMSLRAHYVQESQRLRRTRHSVDGQLMLLQELIQRRGEVLALRRVRAAVARDILKCLERRTQLLENQDSIDDRRMLHGDGHENSGETQDMEGVESTEKEGKEGKSEENEKELLDVLDVWNEIEEKLRDAEEACTKIAIPEEIKVSETSNQLKAPNVPSSGSVPPNAKQSKSPPRGGKDDTTVNGGGSKKKPRRGSDDSGKSSEKDTGKRSKDAASTESTENKETTEDDGIVPWVSQIMPRTPYGIPEYLSYLSKVPDRAAGFGCGGMLGSKKSSICWLESNIPETLQKMGSEREDVLRLREESQFLTKELEKERDTNKELQRQIISGRKRNDEMCAMMTMLRSETEAVLYRHNLLLDTPEARSAAEALHKRAVEEREQRGEEYHEDEFLEVHGEEGDREEHAEEHRFQDDEGGVHEDHVDDEGVFLSMTEEKRMSSAADVDRESGELRHDNENDGDDEGEIDEDDEEDGEILEDERRKPPDEVIFGGEDHEDGGDWGRSNRNGVGVKEGLDANASSERGGGKRSFSERDSEDAGDEMSSTSSPHQHNSFGSGKRRRRA